MFKPITILFVDDDKDDREMFSKAVLEVDPEFRCIAKNDGYEALEYLQNKSNPLPQYIFLDLRMPRMSGKRLLQEIRKEDRLKDIPVIIYTTSDDVEDAKELTQSGAAHFVTKPVNPDEIYFLVSMVVTEDWSTAGSIS